MNNKYVQDAATNHPDFHKWVDKMGFDAALSHPSEHVQEAATQHPDFHKWVDKVGIDTALSHPSKSVQEAATQHLDFRKWVDKMGIDTALNHPNYYALKSIEEGANALNKVIKEYKSLIKQENMMAGDVNTAPAGSSAAMKSEEEPHKDDPRHEEKEKKIAQKVKALAEKQLEMHKSVETVYIASNGQWTLEKSELEE